MKNCESGKVSIRAGQNTQQRGREITYSSAGGESLDDAALLVSLDDLIDGVAALDNLDLLSKAGLGELENGAAGDTVENELVVKRSSDELELALLGAPDDEEVGSTGLSAVSLLAVKPEDLVEAAGLGLVGGEEGRTVVGTDLGVAETANPSADHILGVGVKAHATGGAVHARHERGGDEEEGLLGSLDAELGLGADDSGADVEEGAGTGLGEPLGAIDGDELGDELLNLDGVEAGEGDTEGGHEQALGVQVGAEEAELAIEAAEDLETLEALGGVVKDGSGGHEGDGAVGLELRDAPAGLVVPGGGDHVVGADGLETGVGGGLIGDLAGVGVGEGDDELGGIELVDLGGIGGAVDDGVGLIDLVLEGNGSKVLLGGLGVGHHFGSIRGVVVPGMGWY